MSCTDFSLHQRGGTCYMSAATLLTVRVFLSRIAQTDENKPLRNFLILSNANDHERALGPNGNHSCPLIPQVLRDTYAQALKVDIETKYDFKFEGIKNDFIEKHCQSDDCKNAKKDSMEGGSAFNFLIALLLSVGFKICVKYYNIIIDSFNSFNQPQGKLFDDRDKYLNYLIYHNDPRDLSFLDGEELNFEISRGLDAVLVHFRCNNLIYDSKKGKMNMADTPLTELKTLLTHYMNKFHEISAQKVKGILIGIGLDNSAHAICAFPCKDDFVVCNSSTLVAPGKEGHKCFMTIDEFLKDNEDVLGGHYKTLHRFTFVCSR